MAQSIVVVSLFVEADWRSQVILVGQQHAESHGMIVARKARDYINKFQQGLGTFLVLAHKNALARR